MKCPLCGNNEDKVVDKREINSGKTNRRRRECLKCKKRFTTYESIVDQEMVVIKRNGKKEPFDVEKVKSGVLKAFEKRPFSQKEIETLLMKIEKRITKLGSNKIKSSKIGEIVMEEVKKVDQVAYIRFASVCKNFKDVKSFKKELDMLR